MRKKLLVVDDDPLFIDFVKEILAVEEIDVISAPNGRVALSLIKAAQPAFIVSDLDMPEMNGMELHAHLAKDQETKRIPFFFMTGSSDQSLIQYAKDHGVSLFYKSNLVSEWIKLLERLKQPPSPH